MKKIILFLFLFLTIFWVALAQKNSINLPGRIYKKSASNTNSSNLEFSSSSTGRSITVVNVLGRQIETQLFFTYKLTGKLLVITYEKNTGTEEYTVDENSSTLVSTHLQGYVDGQWGKIYWKRDK